MRRNDAEQVYSSRITYSIFLHLPALVIINLMSFILNIDTSLDTAHVCISYKTDVVGAAVNYEQKDHAAWLHSAINLLLQQAAIKTEALNAVAVVEGPGSYTGLRVGMAAAKGFCYANELPLILIPTLTLMASGTVRQIKKIFNETEVKKKLICPMIDARRMEVYTALYTTEMQTLLAPCAMVLSKNSFDDWRKTNEIIFTGNGSKKWQINFAEKIDYIQAHAYDVNDLVLHSYKSYLQSNFVNTAYADATYLKDFYTGKKV
ncbi:MAG: tRNA (adenosine(37)-N6)-threonylcarbamoyltransferase complex dimerization subunit type 1 TsaB [Sphingobacteriales bacterium]|nr:MAG: tRNA (adenosine(37)-N6)-threonylcarbamoyltransferase complex dimerization subunit type 1 TsaB [Sphingobacteriales bacterium]